MGLGGYDVQRHFQQKIVQLYRGSSPLWKIYKKKSQALETGRKAILWRKLCLSCIFKKSKATEKLKKGQKGTSFPLFSTVSSVTYALFCYRFLPFALHESSTRRLLLVYQSNLAHTK